MKDTPVKDIVIIQIERIQYFTLWGEEADDIDRYVIDDGRLVYWKSLSELESYIAKQGISLRELGGQEMFKLDLDKVAHWVKHPTKHIEPNMFNDAWNFAGDLEATIPFGFKKNDLQKETLKIYNKLFWGLNLPAVTPKGRYYVPTWKHREVLILRDVMRDAIAGFKLAFKNGLSPNK